LIFKELLILKISTNAKEYILIRKKISAKKYNQILSFGNFSSSLGGVLLQLNTYIDIFVLSIYLSIYPSIYLSIYLSIYCSASDTNNRVDLIIRVQ